MSKETSRSNPEESPQPFERESFGDDGLMRMYQARATVNRDHDGGNLSDKNWVGLEQDFTGLILTREQALGITPAFREFAAADYEHARLTLSVRSIRLSIRRQAERIVAMPKDGDIDRAALDYAATLGIELNESDIALGEYETAHGVEPFVEPPAPTDNP